MKQRADQVCGQKDIDTDFIFSQLGTYTAYCTLLYKKISLVVLKMLTFCYLFTSSFLLEILFYSTQQENKLLLLLNTNV